MFFKLSWKTNWRNSKVIGSVLAIAIALSLSVGTTSNAKSTVMNREEIVAMVHRQASAWENGDVAAIVADFADDALFIAARKEFQGKEAIQKAAEDYFEQFTNTKVKIIRIIVEGSSGAVQWNWSDQSRLTQNSSYAEDAIIFELKNDTIVYWREYIEKVT